MELDILIRRIAEVGGCATIIPGNGKRPIGPWKDTPAGTRDVSGDTHLLLCGRSGVFVVDCDDNDAIKAFGVHNTFTVATARGAHFYFKHPGFDFTDSPIAPKTDIKNHGYVVAPGSPDKHVMMDIPIAEAPTALLEILRNRPRPERVTDWVAETPDSATVDHAVEILQRVPPTEDGDGGAKALIAAGYLKGLKIPRTEAIELLEKVYNPRCAYPWTRAELDHKLTDAEVLWEAPKALQHKVLETYEDPEDLKPVDFTQVAPELVWSVHKIFEQDSVNMFVSAPGGMKTWTMLSLAKAVANGEPWLGRFPVVQSPILFLDWENNLSRLLRRMRKISGGEPISQFYYLRNPGDLHDLRMWERIKQIISKKNIGMVFYDSLSAGSNGQDENMPAFAMPLKWAGLIDNVTHVFIHHSKKGGSKENEAARGTSAIQAAVDTMYRFADPVGTTETQLQTIMKLNKAGEGEQQYELPLYFSDAKGLIWDDSPPKTRMAKETPQTLDAKILLELSNEPLGTEELYRILGGKKATLVSCVKTLYERGKIFKQGRQWVYVDHGVHGND